MLMLIQLTRSADATDAFRARIAVLREAGGDGFKLLEEFYSFLSPVSDRNACLSLRMFV